MPPEPARGRRVALSTRTGTRNPSASGITCQTLALYAGLMAGNLPFLDVIH
jgi:hypothetical protein